MKFLRFLFLLMVLFFIAFFFAGGTKVFDPQTIGNFRETFHADKTTASSAADSPSAPAAKGDLQEVSSLDRLSRVLFLKKTIAQKVSKKNYVTIDHIPDSLKNAVISVEDNRFYSHHGFDMEGILRASLVNLQYGQIEEGASTITQQLVKNLFLSHERSFGRKAEELVLALDMEANYSKDEILELYLNTIYFGSNYYGLRDASLGYFGKEPEKLALPEAAMLAGLPNAPSLYSPYVDFMMAKKRQFVVLDAMVRTGCISKDIAEDAKIKPIYLAH